MGKQYIVAYNGVQATQPYDTVAQATDKRNEMAEDIDLFRLSIEPYEDPELLDKVEALDEVVDILTDDLTDAQSDLVDLREEIEEKNDRIFELEQALIQAGVELP